MKKGSDGSCSKLERKTVEKNRRMQMKSLCCKLSSLLPQSSSISKDCSTERNHLDHAAAYIRELQKRVEDLKSRKEMALQSGSGCGTSGSFTKLPMVEIRDMDSTLEVVLICGSDTEIGVLFYDVITVLEEEGAGIINASFSTVGDKIFYTIHSQVTLARIGLEVSRVSERLTELLH